MVLLTMPRRLTIFGAAVAFATAGILVSQTAPANPPERRITAQGASSARNEQGKTEKENTNSPQTTSAYVRAAASGDQSKPETEQENLDIQRKLEWFTGGLVAVGILQALTMIWQAWLLRGTLKAIKIQADHMERQLAVTVSKERAHLRIKFEDVDLTPLVLNEHGTFVIYPLHYKLRLDGMSRAVVLEQQCFACLVKTGSEHPTEIDSYYPMQIPPEIAPDDKPFTGMIFLQNIDRKKTLFEAEESRIASVKEGKRYVFCKGWILYEDAFKDRWLLKFQRKWSVAVVPEAFGISPMGNWEICGGTEANREEKAN